VNRAEAAQIARVLLGRWEPIVCPSPWDNEPVAPPPPARAWEAQVLDPGAAAEGRQ